jgi:hypothetical protein
MTPHAVKPRIRMRSQPGRPVRRTAPVIVRMVTMPESVERAISLYAVEQRKNPNEVITQFLTDGLERAGREIPDLVAD